MVTGLVSSSSESDVPSIAQIQEQLQRTPRYPVTASGIVLGRPVPALVEEDFLIEM